MHEHKKINIAEDAKRLILIGNPNVGKSVIFGLLTGRYVTVSNYPGTTVEVTKGSAVINDEKYMVIDTPGVNSLVPMSEDERVTRDILLNERADSVVLVADTKNLRRALLISLQLIELGLPFSIALNMIDEARSRGWQIDIVKLSGLLGVDIVPTIATQKWGIDSLAKTVPSQKVSNFKLSYSEDIEKAIKDIEKYRRVISNSIGYNEVFNKLTSGSPGLKERSPYQINPSLASSGRGEACSTAKPDGYWIISVLSFER